MTMNSQRLSAGSDESPMDDKKRKRMISNRESARRSRMRKQQQQEELISQVSKLQSENTEINQRINVASQMYVAVDSDNKVLRAQLMELTDRLRTLNSVLQIVEEVSGLAMDIPEIPDVLMEPWQLPCPGQSIMANSVFQF